VFTFGGLRYQHDMFSGFQYQASATAGLGYKIFDTDAIKLSAQLGAGYLRLRPEDLIIGPNSAVIARTLEPAEGSAVGTFGVRYSQDLTKTTTLSDKLLVESGSTDTLITNALALTVKISTKLALSVGYNIQDNTKPPANLKKLDTLETINLVYSF
jgi:putative salt-induced outer membrane protein